jgi:acetylornithine deacetylase
VSTAAPVEMLRKLVSFDTTSAKSNLALIDFCAGVLDDLGVPSERVYDETRGKANLIATIGPDEAGGVVLSGHTDVVPVTGQEWDSDPFELVERGGRLVGRGTTDMKSFLAAALALAPTFAEAPLRRPVHLAFSYDEEVGCLGARRLIPFLAEHVARPAAVIVGEPTNMEVVVAHKGVRSFRTTVTGSEAHSSAPHRGVSAIFVANKLLGFLRHLATELHDEVEDGYDPPYPTLNVGVVEGGTAVNIVPRTCSFLWEYRPLPSKDPTDVRRRFDAFVESEYLPTLKTAGTVAEIRTESVSDIPALEPGPASPAETLALQLAGRNRAHKVSYGSEGGLFREAGFDVVLCGPGKIIDAHLPNESVAVSQVEACVRFLGRLKEHLTDQA